MTRSTVAAALFASILSQAGPAFAQHGDGRAAIPAQFHGRWAASPRACRRPEHQEIIITISRRGWSSWEEGGEVTRVGQVRGDTHYFGVLDSSGPDETAGTMALRRHGDRLTISIHEDGGTPAHYDYVRCR